MSHSSFRTRSFAVMGALIVATALTASACSRDGSTSGPVDGAEPGKVGTPQTSELTISLYQASSAAPIFIGIEEGIYGKYGLTVEPSFFTTIAEGSAALQAGESQMYATNLFGVVDALRAGIELRIVTETLAANPDVQVLTVLPDSPIRSVLDLQGKKVALPAVNSSLDATLNATMTNAGGDFTKIQYVQLPYADMPAALEQGTVDAAIVTGPPLTLIQNELNGRTVWDAGGGEYEGLAQFAYVTSKEFADANPTTIANFQCAYAESVEKLYDDRATYLKHTAAYLKITEEQLDAQPDWNWIYGFRSDKIKQIVDIMLAAGLIDEPFDLNSVTLPFPESCD